MTRNYLETTMLLAVLAAMILVCSVTFADAYPAGWTCLTPQPVPQPLTIINPFLEQ